MILICGNFLVELGIKVFVMEKTIDNKILLLQKEKAKLHAKKQGNPVITKKKPHVYVKPVFNKQSHKMSGVHVMKPKVAKPKPQLLLTNGEQVGRGFRPPARRRRRARRNRGRGGRGGNRRGRNRHAFRRHVARASQLPPPINESAVLPPKEESWIDKVMDVAPSVIEHVLPLVAGMGDYSEPDEDVLAVGEKPHSNSLLSAATEGKVGSEVPYMHNDGNATRIQHREYIGDVYSSTSAFKSQTFVINPGMNETFPWLSMIANQFTCYKLLGMIVEFVSEGSEYTNTAGLGYVALATQYNSYAPSYTDKRSMLNSQFADAAKPSKSFPHWIECKPDTVPVNELYVRAGLPPANADKRLYDHGVVTLAVGGNTADGVVIGELWITYDLEVYLPKTSDATGENILFFDAQLGTPTNAQPLGSATWTPTVKCTFSPVLNTTAQTVTFPNGLRGEFLIRFIWQSSVGVTVTYPTFTATNCTQVTSPPVVHFAPQSGATGITNMSMAYAVIISQDGAYFTLSNGGTVVNPAGFCSITMHQIPLDPPTIQKGSIFDPKGTKREQKYESFMKRFRDPEDDEDDDEHHSCVVLKETKEFMLELVFDPFDKSSEYYLYDEGGQDEDNCCYPIPESFALMLKNLSDESFNQSCVEFIKLICSSKTRSL